LREPDAQKFNLGWKFPTEKKTGVLLVPASGLLYFMNQQIHVPRIAEITGKPSAEQSRAERDWQRARKIARNSNSKHAFGSAKGKAEWLRRIQSTRSF